MPLPERLKARVQNANGKEVIVGLRPEHFSVTDSGDSVYAPIELEVDVAEYIGSSQFLSARTKGKQAITATVDVGPDAEPMNSGTYFFDANRLYLFDRQSHDAI